jgi:pyrroline-5-carboxylate reductase
MRIGLIGGGAMSEAIIRGVLAESVVQPENIMVSEPLDQRRESLTESYAVKTTSANDDVIKNTDIIIIAVKPQSLESALKPLSGQFDAKQVVVSIAAGVRLNTLQNLLSHEQVIRVMPNTPAQVRMGMSVWTAAPNTTEEQKTRARSILAALGKEIYVTDERYIDMATAISGSGPAYVLLFVESFIDAGVHIGLPREQAHAMVLQTLSGTAELLTQSNDHPAKLRNMVTSPGGTTAEALQALEEGGMRASLTIAIQRAFEKSLSLG